MHPNTIPSTRALTGAALVAGALLLVLGAWSQSALGDRLLPHAFCITASAPLLWLHAGSDSLIAISYLLIPWCILRYVKLRGDVPFGWVAWLFGAFIVACGITHLLHVVTLWLPVYWYAGVAKAFTAFVSLGTAWMLYRLTPLALALPSAETVRALNVALEKEVATRKSAEESLRQAQAELQSLLAERTAHAAELEAVLDQFFANAPIGMAVFDEEARILRANPAMSRITRRDEREFAEGQRMTALGLPDEPRRAMQSVMSGGAAVVALPYTRSAPTGEVELSATYFPIAAFGRRRLCGALVQDVTSERIAHRERQQALEAAKAASRAKDEFLARVSHELRSPLQVALVCSEVLRRSSDLQPKALHTVQRLADAVRHQARMIGDLVDISRVLSGKLYMDLTALEPSEPLGAAVEAVTPNATARGVEVLLDAEAGGCLVNGDASRLVQAFTNLLDNAVRFTRDGGHVRVTSTCETNVYLVRIEDQGPGIPPGDVERLFHPFAQGAQQPHQGKGLGLGLAIVRGIVDAHGGRVWAETGTTGATFVVELPLAQGRLKYQAPEEKLTERLDGLRVLYVEDQHEIGEGMRSALELLGATVMLVASFTAAVDAYEREVFDAVLSDINLGEGRSGLDLARTIRGSKTRRAPLLVGLSAYGSQKDHEEARGAGFDVLLVKPADLASVAHELNQARAL